METKFKVVYENLTNKEVDLVASIQKLAHMMSDLYAVTPGNRELSLALTNLEQSVMWAIKGICVHRMKLDE
jgi:hypothetical protein